MRNLYQQRYWTWWTNGMNSIKETPPHLNCQDWLKTSRTASACTNGKNGGTLLKPWTKRDRPDQDVENYQGNWYQSKTRGRERSNCLQWKLVLTVRVASHQVQPTVQYFKDGQTYFFKRDPSSGEGSQEETIGEGTNIHSGPSNESNQELYK